MSAAWSKKKVERIKRRLLAKIEARIAKRMLARKDPLKRPQPLWHGMRSLMLEDNEGWTEDMLPVGDTLVVAMNPAPPPPSRTGVWRPSVRPRTEADVAIQEAHDKRMPGVMRMCPWVNGVGTFDPPSVCGRPIEGTAMFCVRHRQRRVLLPPAVSTDEFLQHPATPEELEFFDNYSPPRGTGVHGRQF